MNSILQVFIAIALVSSAMAYNTTEPIYTLMNDDSNVKSIHKECIEPTPTRKYVFFVENKMATDFFLIKTNWVVGTTQQENSRFVETQWSIRIRQQSKLEM
jgi:hypothetical protein